MNFPGSLTRPSGGYSARETLLLRLLAFFHAPTLDEELAAGIRPSASPAHQLRADHLLERRVRHRIATALNRAVRDASRPVLRGTSQAPLCRDGVRHCSGEIRELATLVATMENPRPRGVAIAFQLAFDGRGALFFQPDTCDGVERLANTLHAAHTALRVSADL